MKKAILAHVPMHFSLVLCHYSKSSGEETRSHPASQSLAVVGGRLQQDPGMAVASLELFCGFDYSKAVSKVSGGQASALE